MGPHLEVGTQAAEAVGDGAPSGHGAGALGRSLPPRHRSRGARHCRADRRNICIQHTTPVLEQVSGIQLRRPTPLHPSFTLRKVRNKIGQKTMELVCRLCMLHEVVLSHEVSLTRV